MPTPATPKDICDAWQAIFATDPRCDTERDVWLLYIRRTCGYGMAEPMRRWDDERVIAAIESTKEDEQADGTVPRMISGPSRERESISHR